MKANERQVLAWIGLSEGGYVNHPKDPGGATDRGITQATFDAWNRRQGKPKRSVRGISKAEAEAIIVSQYFRPVDFDDLPDGLDYAVVDFAVNSGPAQAVRTLQRIVGTAPDGIMGARTMAAVLDADQAKLIAAYCAARLRFMRGLKTWGTFGRGWASRVEQVQARALDMARGASAAGSSIELAMTRAAAVHEATSKPATGLWAALLALLGRIFNRNSA